jgi:hypothetical protein
MSEDDNYSVVGAVYNICCSLLGSNACLMVAQNVPLTRFVFVIGPPPFVSNQAAMYTLPWHVSCKTMQKGLRCYSLCGMPPQLRACQYYPFASHAVNLYRLI